MKTVMCIAACAAALCGGLLSTSLPKARADHGGESRTETRIALTGAAFNGIRPEGHADFRVQGTQRKLSVEVERVNLPDNSVTFVRVNGNSVGSIKVVGMHGELELDSKKGDVVPAIQAADVLTVTAPTGETILTGTF